MNFSKTKGLYLRVKVDEKETFKAASSAAGLDMSAWIRDRLLRASRRELAPPTASPIQNLLDLNPMPMGCWHATGFIMNANDALLKVIGYSKDEVQAGAVRWKDLTPPAYAPRDEQALQEIRAHGSCVAFEKEYIRKDGSHVPVLVGAAAFELDRPDAGAFFVVDLTRP
jgi:PAS domain S-box-containing protein